MKLIAQIIGIIIMLLLITIVTLRLKHQNDDGPSVLFPGGKLVSGELHSGPDPDWSFTDDVFTIDLETSDPVSSRRIFVMESDGKIYVPSGYMKSFLGRLWKDWAFDVEENNAKLAVARIEGVRYERELVRVMDPAVIEGVARKLTMKYAGGTTPEALQEAMRSVADEETWIFELAPRSGV